MKYLLFYLVALSTALGIPPTRDSVEKLLLLQGGTTPQILLSDDQLAAMGNEIKSVAASANPASGHTTEADVSLAIKVLKEERSKIYSPGEIHEAYVSIYQANLDQDDVDGLIALYSTPTWKSWLIKKRSIQKQTAKLAAEKRTELLKRFTERVLQIHDPK